MCVVCVIEVSYDEMFLCCLGEFGFWYMCVVD